MFQLKRQNASSIRRPFLNVVGSQEEIRTDVCLILVLDFSFCITFRTKCGGKVDRVCMSRPSPRGSTVCCRMQNICLSFSLRHRSYHHLVL